MSKSLLTAAAILATAITPAFAQYNSPSISPSTAQPPAATAPAPSSPAPSEFLMQQNPREWRASTLIGSTVTGPDNARIGDINEVVLDSSGNTNAIVIGVGGFLGIGENEVAVPFKSISVVPNTAGDRVDKITVSYTKDQLTNAPAYKWYAATPVPERRSDARQ